MWQKFDCRSTQLLGRTHVSHTKRKIRMLRNKQIHNGTPHKCIKTQAEFL